MNLGLDEWQEKMERHFEALSKQRAHSGLPIFALEHGLCESDLEEIASQLRARLLDGKRLSSHWLLWTIYAAEKGYTYDGDEYWQSFEEATPGWDGRFRYLISTWFSRFQRTYQEVTPSGPWASHFSIIAWPITHAVLPRYLQRQFARALYDLRFQLARLNTIEPGAIGRLIAANSYYSSTRFEQFLQQEELVGRIVLALYARSWLKETSRVLADRFKGLGRGSGTTQDHAPSKLGSPQKKDLSPDIRPDLRLHYKGQGAWSLQLDIPSFKSVASLSAEVNQFLKQTRCTLNGSAGKKPAGWLLSGRRQAVLNDWPDPKSPLIEFEKANGVVSHVLASECRMNEGPTWLFRVGRDGFAREIAGRVVRPGFDYIIVSKDPIEDLLEGMIPCDVQAAGIKAIRIGVPNAVSDRYADWLRQQKLELARTIRVWPAGLPGRNWNGEGQSEWLSTEKPCFGVVSDHHIETLLVALDGGAETEFRANEPGVPTFLQMPELTPGRHVLTVKARRVASSTGEVVTTQHEGHLELRVREPEPWIPGTSSHTGLIVSVDPHDAPLNVFWENELSLSVLGPTGHQVTPHVVLENAKQEEIFSRQVCDTLDLPVKPDVWKARFTEFLRRENCAWRYLEASSGLLKIDGNDLGQHVVRFEHEARPVRWVVRYGADKISVRLVDDTDQEEVETKCLYYSMGRPRYFNRLEKNDAEKGINVEPPGGLYFAEIGKYRDALVVSTGLSGEGFESLGVHPNHGHISDDPKDIVKLLRVFRYWKTARFAGSLAAARRRQVTNVLLHGVFGTLAGWDWARAEARLLESNLAKRYGVSNDEKLCRFSIELATRPQSLTTLYLEELPSFIGRAKSSPLLIRGARLAILTRIFAGDGPAELLPEGHP